MSAEQNFQEQEKAIFEYLKAKLPDTNKITIAEIATHFTSKLAIVCVDMIFETRRGPRKTPDYRRYYTREEMKSESEED